MRGDRRGDGGEYDDLHDIVRGHRLENGPWDDARQELTGTASRPDPYRRVGIGSGVPK